MKNLIRLYLLGMLLAVEIAQAAVVDGLYEAEVLVTSQSSSQRQQAMSQALAQVFRKVTGRSNLKDVPGIADAIGKPDRFLQQYLYRGLSEAQYPIPQSNPNAQLAWFRFDERAVNRVLRDNNLPVWGRTRPATLIWLAVEQDGARYILGSDSAEELRDLLEYEARRQGMALVLPLLDLQDQQTMSFADLWGDFQDSILSASSRYQAEAVLVGRLSLTSSDIWHGRWTLYEGGRNLGWQTQASYPDEILGSGVAGAMETLASRYAQSYGSDTPSVVHLAVTGVTTLTEYARVTNYLNSLELVKGVQPTTISEGSTRFRLDIRGNAEGLAQTIKLGNVLQEEQVVIEPQNMGSSSTANFFTTPPSSNEPFLGHNQGADYTYRLLP